MENPTKRPQTGYGRKHGELNVPSYLPEYQTEIQVEHERHEEVAQHISEVTHDRFETLVEVA